MDLRIRVLGRAEAVENKKDGSYSLIGQTGLERSAQ